MEAPTYLFPCKVLLVVDADTIDLDAELEGQEYDLGFNIYAKRSTRHKFRTRLLAKLADGSVIGIDAPERYTEEGKAASAFVRSMLPVGSQCQARTFRDPGDKYGRWLALIETGGVDVGLAILENGMAVRRFGAPLANLDRAGHIVRPNPGA